MKTIRDVKAELDTLLQINTDNVSILKQAIRVVLAGIKNSIEEMDTKEEMGGGH